MLVNLDLLRAIAQPAPNGQPGHRVSAQFRADKNAVDLFFNSSSGYRAQYLQDVHLGDKANRFTIEALEPALYEAIRLVPNNDKLLQIFEASLAHPWAKVWIHQGPWLLWSKRIERVLIVPSWQAELGSQDKRRRKLARWGALAPEETRFILKGGYVDSGTLLMSGKSAETRRQEIHCLGFT
ncbi:hypothetical protein GPA22_04770 [Aromatoleum toluvorans]|uniref:Uncharacterized protein n=1 Tax=Aromatoleum toluvorans TaxID=92002 RepID=A0ABX1PY48_9RHOO|nr:hypothetical protein [Aromatoleum toluvorans]NMG43041.1 hypothetical protein [Aromatoleum toluvorans]